MIGVWPSGQDSDVHSALKDVEHMGWEAGSPILVPSYAVIKEARGNVVGDPPVAFPNQMGMVALEPCSLLIPAVLRSPLPAIVYQLRHPAHRPTALLGSARPHPRHY